MKKIVSPLFILSFSLPVFSQNLIKNGNMENISASYPCQYAKEGFWFPKAINDWYSDIFVTADPLYYASNRPNCFPVKPHSGRTMAGIIAYYPYMDSGYNYDYHEIIGGAFVQPLTIGQTFKNLLFSTGKSEILAVSHSELNELTKSLVAMPKNTTIEINGYTDNIGNDKTNLLLSQKRADAIANYLIKNGLENKNIIAKGYGSNFNIAPNDTETNRALNRRVEVKIK
jgi:outer membrane protein OmpA-like peptidoglycan-associated protein